MAAWTTEQQFPGKADESSLDAARASPDVACSGSPERIGRFRIEKVLGKGGVGLVYLAYDDQLDRRVAEVDHGHVPVAVNREAIKKP